MDPTQEEKQSGQNQEKRSGGGFNPINTFNNLMDIRRGFGKKAAAQAGETAAKVAGETAAQAAGKAALSNPYVLAALGITVLLVIVFAIANLIDMILVFPLLVSKIVNLHPIVVVVSIIIGSQLAGIVGMIVIIPFIAFFKLLFKEIYKDLSVHL